MHTLDCDPVLSQAVHTSGLQQARAWTSARTRLTASKTSTPRSPRGPPHLQSPTAHGLCLFYLLPLLPPPTLSESNPPHSEDGSPYGQGVTAESECGLFNMHKKLTERTELNNTTPTCPDPT